MFRPTLQRALQPSGQPRTNLVSSTQHGCNAVAAPASKALQRPRNGTTHRVPRLITAPPAPPFKVETTEQLFANKQTYHDNWWDRWMIKYFNKAIAGELGLPSSDDYAGFVYLSKEIMRGRNTPGQHITVAGVLSTLLPDHALKAFRTLFPHGKWAAEFNAFVTKWGFAWLVGPMEVEEVDVMFEDEPMKWRSKVKITKCRYLEATACAGICTNLCKVPTQEFFKDVFKIPLTMNPNFETLECEMLIGVEPPPIEQDAVYGQPCYSVCKIAQGGRAKACHRVDTERSRKGIPETAAPAAAIAPAAKLQRSHT